MGVREEQWKAGCQVAESAAQGALLSRGHRPTVLLVRQCGSVCVFVRRNDVRPSLRGRL